MLASVLQRWKPNEQSEDIRPWIKNFTSWVERNGRLPLNTGSLEDERLQSHRMRCQLPRAYKDSRLSQSELELLRGVPMLASVLQGWTRNETDEIIRPRVKDLTSWVERNGKWPSRR
eukprot:TRINITY_DN115051_c0_g1_i1.p1 TRINITY_DN115051_c0_g1~~TRINITY_DN115051_c0_g1_i1.p1  ORF type:complete len:117 (+),score=8.21 TRINITY_DN115051_c0_g1_i1:3-353(+)